MKQRIKVEEFEIENRSMEGGQQQPPPSNVQFKKLPRNEEIPQGYRLLGVTEAMEHLKSGQLREQNLILTWDIVRLRDGWIEGRGYSNLVPNARFRPNVGHKLAINDYGVPPPLGDPMIAHQSSIREFLYDCEEGLATVKLHDPRLQTLLGNSTVDIDPETGWTPLHSAACSCDLTFLRDVILPHLRKRSPDTLNHYINMRTKQGCLIDFIYLFRGEQLTPLHVAMSQSRTNPEMVEALLNYGAEANILDGAGRTPLLVAIENKVPVPLLEPLLERMWHANVTADMKSQLRKAIEYILGAHASAEIPATPLRSSILSLIKEVPIDLASGFSRSMRSTDLNDAEDIDTYVLILRAIENNQLQIFHALLDRMPVTQVQLGASTSTRRWLSHFKDKYGQTLLHKVIMISRNPNHPVSSVLNKYTDKLLALDQLGTDTEITEDLFWAVDKMGRIPYDYISHRPNEMRQHWLRKTFDIDSYGKERAFRGLQKAARSRKVDLCRQFLTIIADQLCDNPKDQQEREGLEKRLLQEQLADQRMSDVEKGNVMEVSRSLSLEKIFQDPNVLEHHVKQGNDQPTYDDMLGRKPFADALATLILNPFVGTPITIGIYGDWGAGKSSLMLQMEIRLLQIVIEQTISQTNGGKHDETMKQFVQKYNSQFYSQYKSLALMGSNYNVRENRTWLSTLKIASRTILPCILPDSSPQQPDAAAALPPSTAANPYAAILRSIRVLPNRGDKDIVDLADSQLHGAPSTAENASQMDPNIVPQLEKMYAPPILTVRYNAWQYQDEKQALAGLANKIINEMEAAMMTSQWWSMCWCNSVSERHHGRPPIMIILSIGFTIVAMLLVTWVSWKLMSLSSNSGLQALKYGSLPVTLIAMVWAVMKQLYAFILPVSKSLNAMFSPNRHHQNLGYHQQVIDDIQFLMKELCGRPSWIWRLLGWVWVHVFRQHNRDYVIINCSASASHGAINVRVPKSIPSEKLRVVVFVDDLDRCNEDTILQVLSSINLVLSVCEFNVVVGVDKSIILGTISNKIGAPGEAHVQQPMKDEMAERYLEKIVQLPVVLPDPGDKKIGELLARQMGFLYV